MGAIKLVRQVCQKSQGGKRIGFATYFLVNARHWVEKYH